MFDWKYIKAKCKDSTGISPLLVNGSTVSDPQGKADALSNQFQSVFYRRGYFKYKLNDNSFITSISFSTSGIQTLLYNLDPNKAQGPDNLICPLEQFTNIHHRIREH